MRVPTGASPEIAVGGTWVRGGVVEGVGVVWVWVCVWVG